MKMNKEITAKILVICFPAFLSAAAVVHAQDTTALELSLEKAMLHSKQVKNLQNKSQILGMESIIIQKKASIAKTKKECQNYDGCIEEINQITQVNQVNPVVNNQQNQINIDRKINEQLSQLSITAIINNRVVFNEIKGFFSKGDKLFGSATIVKITPQQVFVKTPSTTKTFTLNWITGL